MNIALIDGLSTAVTSFGLVAVAEMGDKTQLVCMMLAARYQALPVLVGAVAAFAILNLLAVVFGAAVAAWLPEAVVTGVVAVLFAIFGIRSWRDGDAEEAENLPERTGRGVLLSTLVLIFLAELGDKTQLAVVGLASTAAALPVWVGATLGLAFTSALGVAAGRTLLQRVPMWFMHRLGGALFLLLAVVAAWRTVSILQG